MISRKIKPVPAWRFRDWRDGYAGTILVPSATKREKLLLGAVAAARKAPANRDRNWFKGVPNVRQAPGIPLHCEGGWPYDRHARKLVTDGFLRIERVASHRGFGNGLANDGAVIRWSYLVPTAKGFEEAARITKKVA